MNIRTPGNPINLTLVGATGMVGGYALRYALDHPAIGRVTTIGRKELGVSHPKLREVLHLDFSDCSALADTLWGQDAVAFCLGAYTGAEFPDKTLRSDNCRLYSRVCSRFARRKSHNAVLISGRKRRRPNGKKPDGFCALQR